MKNKRARLGSEQVLWFYRFLLLVITAGALLLVISAYFSKPYDVREIESSAIANKFVDCIRENSYLVDSKWDNPNEVSKCIGFSDAQLTEFYINATLSPYTFLEEKSSITPQKTIILGKSPDISKINCALGIKQTYYAECQNFRYYLVDKDQNKFILNLEVDIMKVLPNLEIVK